MPGLTDDRGERNLRLVLLAIGLITPPACLASILLTEDIGLLTKLWLGFGLTNLAVWTVVFLLAALHAIRQAFRHLRLMTRTLRRSLSARRTAAEDAPHLAVE